MKEINAIITIAYRDVIKFLRDRTRIIATFIFPIIFIGILGTGLQNSITTVQNYLLFVFTGILAQTLFQSTSSGIISLIEDRENDFSQEIFVSPISRYSIIIGKIIGESLVAFLQVIGILVFGFIVGIHLALTQILLILPGGLIICLLGGSFGVLILSNLNSQRAANQIFPFLILPQFFLAGIFNPVQQFPHYLYLLSRIAPMSYAVDFLRGILYQGSPAYNSVIVYPPLVNLVIMTILFLVFILVGTTIFVRNEQNK